MLLTHPTEPTGSTPVQNMILTSEVVEVATSVTFWFNVLYAELENGYAPTDIYFDFLSRTQAERAEHLLCKIVATSDPDVVVEVARDFPGYVDQRLQPLIQSLNAIEDKALKDDPEKTVVRKLQLHRQKMEKFRSRAVELADELKVRLQNRSWEMVAVAWVGLNDFIAKTVRLHNAFASQESKWHRCLRITPSGPRRTSVHNARFGPVARTESGVRAAYKPLLINMLAGFCRTIASTWNTNGALGVTADQKEIVSAHDELFNHCSPLRPDLSGDGQIQKFITTQGRFCKLMQGLIESGITSEAEELSGRQSVKETTTQKMVEVGVEPRKYVLRKGLGGWILVFNGSEAQAIRHGVGIDYAAFLLKNPSLTPIHAIDLGAAVWKCNSKDASEVLTESSGKEQSMSNPQDIEYEEQLKNGTGAKFFILRIMIKIPPRWTRL